MYLHNTMLDRAERPNDDFSLARQYDKGYRQHTSRRVMALLIKNALVEQLCHLEGLQR